jgi:hypothetical protein
MKNLKFFRTEWYMLKYSPKDKLVNKLLVQEIKKVLSNILIAINLSLKIMEICNTILKVLIPGLKVFVKATALNTHGEMTVIYGFQINILFFVLMLRNNKKQNKMKIIKKMILKIKIKNRTKLI